VQCYAKDFDEVVIAAIACGVSIVEIWVILPHVRVVRVDGFASFVPVSKSGMPIGKCYVSTFVTTPMLGAPVTIGAISPCFHAPRATALISYPWPISRVITVERAVRDGETAVCKRRGEVREGVIREEVRSDPYILSACPHRYGGACHQYHQPSLHRLYLHSLDNEPIGTVC